jgi:hypothetical protein
MNRRKLLTFLGITALLASPASPGLPSRARATAIIRDPSATISTGVTILTSAMAGPSPRACSTSGNGRPESASARPFPALYAAPPQDKPPAKVDGVRIVHLGHASFLYQIAGLNVLIDPVYSERASPFSFIGPRRVNEPGIAFADLPPIDRAGQPQPLRPSRPRHAGSGSRPARPTRA